MFLQYPLPLTLLTLCSFQRGLWKMVWYKQGITFLSHCSFPICSVLTAQPIIKAITQIQFCLLHSTQQSQVLLLTAMEVERDDQQARSFPDSIWFSQARGGYEDNISFYVLSAPLHSGLGHISIAHCAKPQGQERKERSWHGSPFCGPTHRECNNHVPILGHSLAVNAAFEIF